MKWEMCSKRLEKEPLCTQGKKRAQIKEEDEEEIVTLVEQLWRLAQR